MKLNKQKLLQLIKEECDTLKEDKDGNYMSIQNLKMISASAQSVLSKISEGEQLDDWVEDKISKMAESMRHLRDYFEFGHSETMEEAFIDDEGNIMDFDDTSVEFTDEEKLKALRGIVSRPGVDKRTVGSKGSPFEYEYEIPYSKEVVDELKAYGFTPEFFTSNNPDHPSYGKRFIAVVGPSFR